jgi:hypothetical protein
MKLMILQEAQQQRMRLTAEASLVSGGGKVVQASNCGVA